MINPAIASSNSQTPMWLKILAAIGIIWYAFGLLQFWLAYSMDTTDAIASGAITPPHGAALDGTHLLIWLTFAVASATGLIGAFLLFSRNEGSKRAFGISLASAAIYYGWIYGFSGTGSDRPSEEIIIAVVVGSVTLTFLWMSRRIT